MSPQKCGVFLTWNLSNESCYFRFSHNQRAPFHASCLEPKIRSSGVALRYFRANIAHQSPAPNDPGRIWRQQNVTVQRPERKPHLSAAVRWGPANPQPGGEHPKQFVEPGSQRFLLQSCVRCDWQAHYLVDLREWPLASRWDGSVEEATSELSGFFIAFETIDKVTPTPLAKQPTQAAKIDTSRHAAEQIYCHICMFKTWL